MSYAVWLEQADDDLDAARVLGAANHHSQAVWLTAQAVEKAHKAIFVALGLRYEERHFKQMGHGTGEMARLLPDVLCEPRDPAIAGRIEILESGAQKSRYPAPVTGVQGLVSPAARIQSSQQELEDAATVVEWCRERILRAVRAVEAMRP